MKTKPFPWKCVSCRQATVFPAVVDYTTTIEHDGRSYDVRVPALDVPKCQNCGRLVMVNEANAAISDAFRSEAGLLTPNDIRSHRAALGLTQKVLAERLGIAEATLSRWETGAQIPQRHSDLMLRAFFAVPEFRAYLEQHPAGGPSTTQPAIPTGLPESQFAAARS